MSVSVFWLQSGISLLVFIQGGRRVEVSCVRKRGPGQFCCVLLSAALTFALWFDGHVSDPPGLACETAAPMLSEPAPRAFSRSMSLQSPEAASAASAPSQRGELRLWHSTSAFPPPRGASGLRPSLRVFVQLIVAPSAFGAPGRC